MSTIWFYFDFSCAYAYIALHKIPDILQGLSWQINYCPIAYNNSPTVQQTTAAKLLAQEMQLPFQTPASYPFDSTPWLHISLTASPHFTPSRYICSTLFNYIWQHGRNPQDMNIQQQAWKEVTSLLPHSSESCDSALAQKLLSANNKLASRYGISDTPSFVLHTNTANAPQVFCGLDMLPKLQAAVQAEQTLN